MTKTSSTNSLKKKLEEGRIRMMEERRRRLAMSNNTLNHEKPLVTYLINVFPDGTVQAEKLTNNNSNNDTAPHDGDENKNDNKIKEEKDREESTK
jgi:hypothetical protein